MEIRIKPMKSEDWAQVREIYLQGIATGCATFETTAPTWEKWDASHHTFARLVAQPAGDDTLSGWAALSPFSTRAVYAGVAEVSLYVAAESRGQGVGTALLRALIAASEANGIWTLQAGIMAINPSSLALHARCGFRTVGFRERIGQLHGVWHDTVLMERRSSLIG
jgi:L-amino acid N-acyltransferase YncA